MPGRPGCSLPLCKLLDLSLSLCNAYRDSPTPVTLPSSMSFHPGAGAARQCPGPASPPPRPHGRLAHGPGGSGTLANLPQISLASGVEQISYCLQVRWQPWTKQNTAVQGLPERSERCVCAPSAARDGGWLAERRWNDPQCFERPRKAVGGQGDAPVSSDHHTSTSLRKWWGLRSKWQWPSTCLGRRRQRASTRQHNRTSSRTPWGPLPRLWCSSQERKLCLLQLQTSVILRLFVCLLRSRS